MHHSRRDFLKPRSIAQFLSTVTGGELDLRPMANIAHSGMLCRTGVDSMATRFEILFEAIDLEHASTAEKGLEQILELESQMTVYREESELCAINRSAYEAPVEVEPRLFELFELSRMLWEETAGTFDITLHELLKIWGVFKGPTRVPTQEEIDTALQGRGFDRVELDSSNRAVRFKTPHTAFNLAAIGKGYALDRVSETLIENGMEHFLLHGGQSSLYAKGATTWEQGWLVELLHPLDHATPVAKILLKNQSLSTSVLIPQKLRGGPVSGHILDPRTGLPVEGNLLSASVLTRSAAVAEALSTAFLVMGLDKALEYCENHPRLGAVLTLSREDSTTPEIRIIGSALDCVEVLS
ncbi:MAG: FAD:protein FMN transferase [Candidatus Omnitrophica bacterium]|nr:FAD:protein FMN transferase [Candidatus Omnitrophota bacterium]MCA9424058.1 FAD:protein FMN transferase [Candidatus Omnitrophota bacterium]MCA9432402.1 FAD:protein FMN transferase [Candidatus Omnitrophota bacterium]MCA9435210.1 FAD:protein FMN transferase [Candidatus Omnitrophota bacterium]MCB9768796.1 FAD:protein FMN transferase [Candidatus Omnitrophota bacterium]